MYRCVPFATAILLFIHAATAQTVSRAYAGKDGKAHVIYADGAAKAVPLEKQQVGCDSFLVAADKRTVGWSVLVKNCCTSYPIPTAIVLYRDGRKTIISPPQMIYKWHFTGERNRIAVLFGPVHGGAAGANLYDVSSGELAASWNGKDPVPQWAKDWESEFDANN